MGNLCVMQKKNNDFTDNCAVSGTTRLSKHKGVMHNMFGICLLNAKGVKLDH